MFDIVGFYVCLHLGSIEKAVILEELEVQTDVVAEAEMRLRAR